MRSRGGSASVGIVLAALLGGGVAQAADPATLVTVSGPSPYAHCSDAGHDGFAYTNAEVEPQVAVNPRHLHNFIGVFQQDRWSTGASRGDVAAYTQDSGATWHETTLPF